MARPKKATVDYFPHYVNDGKTIYILESKFGNDGYAFWFKLLSLLGSTDNHYIDCNSITSWEFLLAKTLISGDIVNEMLNILAEMGSIDKELWSKRIIWSENFIDNLDTVYSRREINPYNKQDIIDTCLNKHPVNEVSVNINSQSKVKERKGKESITINIQFSEFWDLYDYKKNKDECEKLWIGEKKRKDGKKINDEERSLIIFRLPKYIESTFKNGEYPGRSHPHTYLYNKGWEDEIPALKDSENTEKLYDYSCPDHPDIKIGKYPRGTSFECREEGCFKDMVIDGIDPKGNIYQQVLDQAKVAMNKTKD